MRNSFVSWLTAAAIAFGFSVAGVNAANAQSVMRACATEWKQAQTAGTTGGQAWPQFLAQCRTRQGSAAAPSSATAAPAPQSGSLFPWSQPSAPTSTAASNVGAPAGGQSVMRLCASQWKDAKAAGTTGGPDLAAVSIAMPHTPRLRRFVLGRFRSCAGPCPSARSCLPVRLPVPVVATVGSLFRAGIECWRALDPAGRPIHDGARGARSLPVGHRRVGQHADAHLSLFGNPLLRAHPQGRIYVRS